MRTYFSVYFFKARTGITLFEVICAIAIVGLLISLLLPSVQAARESVRRLQCQNKMRQLGIAIHEYADSFQCLPISVGPWPLPDQIVANKNGKGWIVSILPYLEQQVLYDDFSPFFNGDFFSGGGLNSEKCRSLLASRVSILICPSDYSGSQLSNSQVNFEGIDVSLTNYKGVIGDTQLGGNISAFPGSLPDCHAIGGCPGLFFRTTYLEPQRLASVSDGLSNTFMIGEDIPAHNARSAAFFANGDWSSCNIPLNHFPTPPTPRQWDRVASFRSQHVGGASFCNADASIVFVSDSVHVSVYKSRSTKSGGEVFSNHFSK